MSLQVWLPLNGDLHNQGCSDITVTNNGATVDDTGKIGKCYNFSSHALSFQTPFSKTITDFSIAGWVNLNSGYTANNGFHLISFGLSYGRICISKDSAAVRVLISNNGSNIGISSTAAASTLSAGIWNHFVVTFSNGVVKIYINGNLDKEQTVSISSFTYTSDTLAIGSYGSEYAKGKLNDLRIYDHALSAAEVREISQGLVLHYKLDGINNASVLPSQYQQLEYIESAGTSYFNTGYKFNAEIDSCKVIFKGNDTSNNGMIFASSGTKYFWFYYYGSSGIRIYANNGSDGQKGITGISSDLIQHTMEFKNKTYYIDDVNKGSLTDTYTDTTNNIWLFSYNNNGYPFKGRIYYVEIKKNNQYQRIFIPAKRLNDSAIGMYDLITNTFYTSSNAAFTAGTAVGTLAIEDSSGYNHNGIINGTLTVSNDAVRYFSSVYMPQATTITHTRPVFGGTDQEWTCSMWVKLDTINQSNIQMNNFNLGNRIVHSANGQALMYLNSGANDYYNYGNLVVTANTWTHIAFVFKNSNATKLIYINGINHTNTNGPNKTSTPAGIPDTVIVGTNLTGYISDYRIYCTALDADVIRQLYEVGAKIDNKQNLHAFELVENNSKIQITKRGQVKCNELEENEQTKFYQTDQIIETNEIIEL